MAVVYMNKTLLNPYEKGTKAFDELQNNVRLTNDGYLKVGKNGRPVKLTNTQKSWRSGYLAAQKDSREAFKAKHPNYKRKKS